MSPLDPTVKQNVRYCIPLWLRDQQIKLACARVKGRIQPAYEKRTDPVAVVGFGPSLNDTWEKVKDFKYVISCSGSHKFLIDHGIIPTWHVEVDPRDHKVKLIGPPHKDVEYLIASTCSPAVFDHLEGHKVTLWHVFDSKEEGVRTLPHGEWALTGGCDAGLRSMVIAGFLGFRDLHIFGMDGCGRDTSHAAEHPNAVKKYSECVYDGVTYQTTPALLEAARSVPHELNQMPTVKATFYGEGLIQHMMRNHQPKQIDVTKPFENIVGFKKETLITPEYVEQNRLLHQQNLAYGVGGAKHVATVMKIITGVKPPIESVLDYGCGKGLLAQELKFPIWEYDPCIPGKEDSPRPADLVVCTDVLEHIEPEKIMFVLGDLKRVTKRVGFFTIHTGPAAKTLPDGRNTHLIQKDINWWSQKLKKFFNVTKVYKVGLELVVLVQPKAKK